MRRGDQASAFNRPIVPDSSAQPHRRGVRFLDHAPEQPIPEPAIAIDRERIAAGATPPPRLTIKPPRLCRCRPPAPAANDAGAQAMLFRRRRPSAADDLAAQAISHRAKSLVKRRTGVATMRSPHGIINMMASGIGRGFRRSRITCR